MYRSVTPSRQPRADWRRVVYRLEGLAVALAIFLGVFYALGWLSL